MSSKILPQPLICAAAAYDFGGATCADDYFLKVETLARKAPQNQAHVLLLPKYAGYEGALTLGFNEKTVLSALPQAMDDYCACLEEIAARHNLMLILRNTSLL